MKTCTKCGETKPPDQFSRDASRRDGLNIRCRPCHQETCRRWRQTDPERARAGSREYNRRWRQKGAGRARERERPGARERFRRLYEQSRAAVFDHYGRSCACCGAVYKLTIDHVHGDGREHRAEVGMHIYRWLVRNGFPDGFQVLCMPCNSSKWTGERCRLDHAAARTP